MTLDDFLWTVPLTWKTLKRQKIFRFFFLNQLRLLRNRKKSICNIYLIIERSNWNYLPIACILLLRLYCNRYCSVKGMRNVHFRLRNAEWSIIERPPHEPRYLYCLYPKIVLSCPSPRRPAFGFFFRCVNISITHPFPSHPPSFPPGDLARSRKIWRFHLQHGLHYFVWTCYSWGLEQNHQGFYFIAKIYIFPDDIPS